MAGTSGVRYFAVTLTSPAVGASPALDFGRWASFSGGEPTVTVGSAWNGGAKVPDRTQSRPIYANVTLSRPYNPGRDKPKMSTLHRIIGTGRTFTIAKQDLDANDERVGKPDVWTGCLIVRIGEPVYSEDDSSPSMWELELAPQGRSNAR